MSTSRFEVGDTVRLTGPGWDDDDYTPRTGTIHVVKGFHENIARGDGYGTAAYVEDQEENQWYLDESAETEWAAEIVEEEA